jgi:hypothetical protein
LENEEERLGSQIRQAIATRKKKAAGPGKEESSTVKKKPGPWAALMSVEKGATFSLYMVRLKRNLWLLKDGVMDLPFVHLATLQDKRSLNHHLTVSFFFRKRNNKTNGRPE